MLSNSNAQPSSSSNSIKMCSSGLDLQSSVISFTAEHWMNRANECIQKNEVEAALDALDKAVEYSSDRNQKLVCIDQQLEVCLQSKRFHRGIDICNNVLSRKTIDYPERLLLKRAECKLGLKQIEEALKDFEQSIKFNDQYAFAFLRWGTTLLSTIPTGKIRDYAHVKQLFEAMDLFTKGIQVISNPIYIKQPSFISPESDRKRIHSDLLYLRGTCLIRKREFSDALNDFGAILKEVDPNYAPAYYGQGEVALLQKNFIEALVNYSKFYDMFPDYYAQFDREDLQILDANFLFADVVLKQGICYLETDDLDSALLSFDTIINVHLHSETIHSMPPPENISSKSLGSPSTKNIYHLDKAYYFRAKIWMQRGEWWKAIQDHTAALKINRNLFAALEDRANAYAKLGMEEESMQDRRLYQMHVREKLWRDSADS